ncbi:MAG: OmpA family protein [Flavobacteriia bacterium]|nr:OmpA family protein [Flavobacteriia bacterium]
MKSKAKSIVSLTLVLTLYTLPLMAQKKGDKNATNKKPEVETDNLVENGSFEATVSKPKKLGGIDLATGWVSPTGARADLFMGSNKVPEISVPINIYGKEEAQEGENYAGIVNYSYGDKMFRTYIMAKLKTPLKKGQKYCVSFYISLAELSKYSSNSIGMHISKKPFGTDAKTSIIDKTHIQHKDNKIFNAMYNWDKVCGTFEADGGEKHVTIGNFNNNDQTKYERNKKNDFKGTPIISAYYYVDNVSVTPLEEGKKCDCLANEEKEVSTTIYAEAIMLKDDMTDKEKIEAQTSYFAAGKNMLQPNAQSSLDIIVDLLKKNPSWKIEITGYNDEDERDIARENPLFEDMDLKRVEVVERYLNDKGINSSRIVKKIGEVSDVNPKIIFNDSDDLKKAKTRRVSYKVVE